MIDIPTILEMLNTLQEKVEAAREHAENAKDFAHNAESDAERAKSEANDAENNAYSAQSAADEAMDACVELDQDINELMDLLKKEQGSEGEKSLQADIRKWKPRVAPALDAGHSHAKIADAFSISEFLVQCIEDEHKKAEQAA